MSKQNYHWLLRLRFSYHQKIIQSGCMCMPIVFNMRVIILSTKIFYIIWSTRTLYVDHYLCSSIQQCLGQGGGFDHVQNVNVIAKLNFVETDYLNSPGSMLQFVGFLCLGMLHQITVSGSIPACTIFCLISSTSMQHQQLSINSIITQLPQEHNLKQIRQSNISM